MFPPILIIIAIAVCLGGGSAAVAYFWDDIIRLLRGKKIAVMGERTVGKSSLIQFFQNGTIPEKYIHTSARKIEQTKRLKLKELELVLKSTMDYGGDSLYYPDWKKLYLEADIVFYLLRADKILAGDQETEKRVTDDLSQIRLWKQGLSKEGKKRPFFIVGTYCDKDPDFLNFTPNTSGSYADKFRRLPVIEKLRAFAANDQHPVKVILGSTLTKEGTELIAFQILTELQTMENP